MPVVEAYMHIANSDTLKTSLPYPQELLYPELNQPNITKSQRDSLRIEILQYSFLLPEEQRQRALDKAKTLTEELVRQAEESVAYSLSLGPEYYVALEEERSISLQVCKRLKKLFEYYHPEDEYASELDARLDSLKMDILNYQRNIVDLESINF